MSSDENVAAALRVCSLVGFILLRAIAIDLFINNETRDWSDRMGVPL